jgi:hypothetical protein
MGQLLRLCSDQSTIRADTVESALVNQDTLTHIGWIQRTAVDCAQSGREVFPDDCRKLNCRKRLKQETLDIDNSSISFILPASKTDRFFAGNKVLLRDCNLHACPINAAQ